MEVVHGPHFGTPSCFQKRKKRTTMPHFNQNTIESVLFFIVNIYVIVLGRAILPAHE